MVAANRYRPKFERPRAMAEDASTAGVSMTDRWPKHAEDYKAFEACIISDFDAQSAVAGTGTAIA